MDIQQYNVQTECRWWCLYYFAGRHLKQQRALQTKTGAKKQNEASNAKRQIDVEPTPSTMTAQY